MQETIMQETITLDSPIKRGEILIESIVVSKPKSGALRGIALTDLLRMEVAALTTALPRLTEPKLTEQDIQGMDPADLLQLGTAVVGFLLPKQEQAAAFPAE